MLFSAWQAVTHAPQPVHLSRSAAMPHFGIRSSRQLPTTNSQLPTTPNSQPPTPNNFQLEIGSWKWLGVGRWELGIESKSSPVVHLFTGAAREEHQPSIRLTHAQDLHPRRGPGNGAHAIDGHRCQDLNRSGAASARIPR